MNARIRISALVLSALSFAAACGAPPVSNALDQYNCPSDGGPCTLPPPTGVIQGTVVYQGPRRGDVVLLLFAANNLPPPDGTATSAVELARVASATMFAGAAPGATGPFSAPYLFTEVAPGNYQIRAFIDLGGDFAPLFDFTQSPRAGAPIGGTVTFDAHGQPTLASFAVASNAVAYEQVVLGAEVPFDPPAFQVASGSSMTFPQNIDRPQALVLQAFNPGVPHADFGSPKFTVQLKPGADGGPQESDGDGLLDVYPQVSLLQTQALQADGTSLPVSGANAAIVPCKVLPISLWPLLVAQPAGQFGVDSITVLIEPFAVKFDSAGDTLLQPQIPAGQYELVVAERTGQIWTLPNALGSQPPSSGEYVASQATSIQFTTVSPPAGAISGVVHYPPGRTPHNLVIQAFLGGAQFAPPLAAQLPARVLSVPGRFISLGTDRNYAYTIPGLSPGTYVVEALDDGDGNFNDVDILQTPTRGDLVGGVLDNNGNLASITVAAAAVANQTITLVSAPGQDGQGNGTALDPPAFVLDESSGPAQIAQDARGTVRVEVQAQPDPFPALDQQAQTTLFTVGLVRDASGQPVDSDGDGLPDVWPRAFLFEIDPADPQGLALKSPAVALPAAVDPTPFLPALLDPSAPAGLVLPATRLSIIVRPTAVDLTNPAAPVRLPVMPAGSYKLILMNKTGQLWELPNSSGASALDPRAAALVDTASQSRAFAVVPPAAPVPAGEIDGTATISGGDAIHSVYVFAYSTSHPPPPYGTGTPVSADFHAASELVTNGANKQVAFALRGLPADSYFVVALADARGDFAVDPTYLFAAPGPGSFTGAHLDANFALAPVTVAAAAVPNVGVNIAASDAAALPARPSFELTIEGLPVTSDLTSLFPDAVTPARITLTGLPVLNAQTAALDPESGATQFPVSFQSCSATDPSMGADNDFDNLPDLYPRILVVRLADSDASGLTIDPANIAIPAAIDPTPYLGALGSCANATTVLASNLSVILQPVAVQQLANGSLVQMAIPAGRYGVVLESKTGQLWRIPNELQPALLDPRAAATSAGQALATQGVAIRLDAQVPAALGGGISGAIALSGQTATSLGNLLVAAYAASAPPPPLGLGRPLAVELIPRNVVQAAAGGTLPYALENLAPGEYVVAALNDPRDELSPSLDFLSTPPLGAQVAFVGGAVPAPILVASSIVGTQNIDLDGALDAIPFERPSFELDGTLSLSSSRQGATASLQLAPFEPSGLPYTPVSSAAFHPTTALNGSGQPYRLANAVACKPSGVQPWASSAVYVTPLDTGERYVPYVEIDSCQFCEALTGTADCSGALLAPPKGPLAMTTPITVIVTSTAIDPLTQQPADVALPPGHYAVTLVESTGQSWTVPNALSEVPGDSGLAQSAVFTVLP